MSDMGDTFKAMREDHIALRGQRAVKAWGTFARARDLARRHGLRLSAPTHFQYQLQVGDALYNLYPSTQRIQIDRHHRGPRLDVPRPWGLLDVVRAAIKLKDESEVT